MNHLDKLQRYDSYVQLHINTDTTYTSGLVRIST